MTPSSAGEITLEFPTGSFVAAELRRVPPIDFGGKAQMHRAMAPPMKPTPASSNGQTELYKWSFAAGEEMQLDILFAPSFSKDQKPGLRSAAMKFSGVGAILPWTVQIPMRGTVNTQKLDLSPQPPMPLDPRQQSTTMRPANMSDSQSTQAAAGAMYKDVLGRPGASQSSAAAPSNAGSQSAPGQQPSSAASTSATQSAYKGVLGRSSSGGQSAAPANSPALPPSKVSKSDKQSAPAQVPSSTSEVLPTSKVSKSDKQSAPAQVPSSTSEVLPTSKVSKSDKQSVPAQIPSATSQVLPTSKVSKSDKISAPAQPPPLPLPPSSAFVDNTPQHSPDQFDFGEVWNGDFAKKTLSLTTNAAGYVTIQIPDGPFRVGEFREMGGVTGLKSKNSPNQQKSQQIVTQQIKSRIVYPDGKTGPFQWSMAPDAEMQLDIYFQPHFNLFTEAAGQKSATMKVTGPGPKGNWAFSIPLHGMFDGLKVNAPIVPEIKELYAVGGDSKALLNLSIAGLGTPVQGTLKGGQQLPQGVSVVPKSVKVPAGQLVKTSVELSLGNFAEDGVPRPLELVFETANSSSKAQLQFIGVSASGFDVNSGDRGNCGVSRVSLSLSISSPQQAQDGSRTVRIIWVNKGWNYDLIKRHYVWMVAESGGVRIFDRVMVMPENHPDEVFENSAGFGGGAPGSLKVSAEQWAQIVKGPLRFGCQESENLGNPKPENPKWGPAFKGSKI